MVLMWKLYSQSSCW